MKFCTIALRFLCIGILIISTSATADTLLDFGHQAGFTAPSFAIQNANFEYQPFVVQDPGGWNITAIGMWSGLVQDDNAVGMLGRILADNAGIPDEEAILAEETWTLTGDIFSRTLDYQDYQIHLPQGFYWFQALPGGIPADGYIATVGAGVTGPPHWFNYGAGTPPEASPGLQSLAIIIEGSIDTSMETVSAGLTCTPDSGTLPFTTQMTASLTNIYTGQARQFAATIDVYLGGGGFVSGWRTGYTNVAAGDSFTSSWSQTLPALDSLIGPNRFTIVAEDVTPAPFNQPPYPPAGGTDFAGCIISCSTP